MADPFKVWNPVRERNGTCVVASEAMWREPVKWNKAAACDCHARADLRERHLPSCPQADRPRVFCASLADVFEDWTKPMTGSDGAAMHVCSECGAWRTMERMCHGPNAHMPLTMADVRTRLFDLIDATPNLDWLLLTKRPENVAKMLPERSPADATEYWRALDSIGLKSEDERERPNLWLGTSVESQAAADERIPHLLRVPAAVRFLSCEPLLSEVRIGGALMPECDRCGYHCDNRNGDEHGRWCQACGATGQAGIDWVIVGCESGPRRRPMQLAWAESLVEQCRSAGVACFMKQMEVNGKVSGDIETFPESLRVREFPAVKAGAP